jgi:hypothetical protein
MRNSKAQSRLAAATDDQTAIQETGLDPLHVHALIFSSYIDNWRWYIHSITRECGELVSIPKPSAESLASPDIKLIGSPGRLTANL